MSYFLHNQQISAKRCYVPLLRYVLAAFAGEPVLLTLDTSLLWDQFCLIAVCFVWGGRSFTLAQAVLEHGNATVGFEQYQSMRRQLHWPVATITNPVPPSNCRLDRVNYTAS